jgi:thiol:disulfide interchange protein
MKTRFGLLALLLVPLTTPAADAPKSAPPIYDESLDAENQIAQAIEQAKKENKTILLQFGANWCGWCHKLHKLFDTDKAITSKLKSDYIVVMVDVNKGHNNATTTKYKAGQRGIPCIVILDPQGKHLTTKETDELEEGDHHSPEKVLAFLNQWSPKKV